MPSLQNPGPSKRLKLLHLAEDGDTSGYFPQLARKHDRDHYAMTFATLKPMRADLRQSLDEAAVPSFSCGATTRAGYPGALINLVRGLRREKVDIIHTHLFDPSVVGLIASFIARTPVRVMTRHYSDYHTRINKTLHVRADQVCSRLATGVIAVSSHTADHMVSVEGAPASKIRTIHNGIDFERVRTSGPGAAARVRQELGLDGPVVLVPARLHPEKGHTYLFRSLPGLKATFPDLHVLLAGVGPYESAYRAEIQALGCADMVRFLGFRRDLPDLMAAADVVALPSVAEAFGLVVAEALFLGATVVATRAGGIPEIIDDGVDGLLVPPANAESLALALTNVLRDATLRARLSAPGREKVLRRFSFERMVRAYESYYQDLLAKGSA